MKNVGMGKKWIGRPYTVWTGTIRELKRLIPTFTISEFSEGDGVNEFLSIIVRKPLDEIYIIKDRDCSGKYLSIRRQETWDEIGRIRVQPEYGGVMGQPRDEIADVDEIDPKSDKSIPIATVRSEYTASLLQNWQRVDVEAGYKLVQHHQVLNTILKTLEEFSIRATSDSHEIATLCLHLLRDPEALEAELRISKYGARMRIQFLVPHYKFYLDDYNSPYSLKVVCVNSADKSIALRIHLFWQGCLTEVPIARFGRYHQRQSLADETIEKFLNYVFDQLTNGEWFKKHSLIVSDETVKEGLLKGKFEPAEVERILAFCKEFKKIYQLEGGISLLILGRAIMSLDKATHTLEGHDQLAAKFFNFIENLFKRE